MPIIGVVGYPGDGKTAYACRWAYNSRRADSGRRVIANFPLYLPGSRPVEYFDDLRAVFDLRDCLLIVDEIQTYLDARSWSTRDSRTFTAWVSQLRKRNVELLYTTQSLGSVDKLVRDRTEYSYWPKSWRKFGFFLVKAYFGVRPVKAAWFYSSFFWFNPLIMDCYDTYHIVGA